MRIGQDSFDRKVSFNIHSFHICKLVYYEIHNRQDCKCYYA